ncbi:hypothetical protein ACFX11_011645 [Malus domestica]
MADAPSSPATNPLSNPQSGNPNPQSNQPDPVPASSTPSQSSSLSSTPITVNPDSNPPLVSLPPPPSYPSISFAPQQVSGALPPVAPFFRPVPQFTPIPNPGVPNPNYQIPGVQPPGVSSGAPMAPGVPPPSSAPQNMMHYQMQPMRPYAPMPNGYAPMSTGAPQGALPGYFPFHGFMNCQKQTMFATECSLPLCSKVICSAGGSCYACAAIYNMLLMCGLPRYPSYHPMIRTPFPPRPPGATGLLQRAPVPGIPGVRPIIPPVVRPILPIVTPAEKPQTTVYVGKIAPTVDNEFMKYLLQLCGPVKSWKRAQDPTDGTPRRFGFCEFESAEGVLRALRLLTNLSIDGQDLVLNVNQATREYLERVVKKKIENSKKLKEAEAAEKGDGSALDVEKIVPSNPSVQDSKEEDGNSSNKENDPANFGIVTDEDKEADREAMEKLTSLIEERIKNKPLPPPPPTPAPGDGTRNSNSAPPAKSRDGDSDVDITRNDAYEEKIDEEITSDNKTTSEQGSPQTSSHDRSRKQDRRSRDNERDMKREKEREIERYERETERERVRKEKEQRRKLEDAEHQYEKCLKDWEYREREKEKQRQSEKEREKERERKRRKEIIYEEDDEDEDSRKKWRRSVLEEKRKRRLREKEDDLADRQKEEEEIAEAKGRAEEEKQLQQERDALRDSSGHVANGSEKAALAEEFGVQLKDKATEQDSGGDSGHENHIGDGTLQNGNSGDESTMTSVSASEPQQSGSAPAKKLGFGLLGSGKRTAVPSVFNEEDDDAHKDKKMRPLVPIDYSTEELQAVQPISGTAPSNLAAAAEFAKRISNASSKEEKPVTEKERSRRSNDRSSHRDRDQNGDDSNRTRDEHREKTIDRDTDRDHAMNKPRTKDNKKLLDAKQLIDMIPKTKEELFSYEINWAIYEHHALHERMRPWISKKITEFLGEEETTLVDYIVSSTQEHVGAERMLQLLQSILDEEAEMFVLKMWRMLIFEIKKVETVHDRGTLPTITPLLFSFKNSKHRKTTEPAVGSRQ